MFKWLIVNIIHIYDNQFLKYEAIVNFVVKYVSVILQVMRRTEYSDK